MGCVAKQQEADVCLLSFHGMLDSRRQLSRELLVAAAHFQSGEVPPGDQDVGSGIMTTVISVAILAVAFKVIPLFATASIPKINPPMFVQSVVLIEAIYGAAQLLYVPTLLLPDIFGLVPLSCGDFTLALSVLVGMIWVVIAINLQHGARIAWVALIALSIVRSLDSLAGLLISLVSMLLLLGPQGSRRFFFDGGKTKDITC